MHYDKSKDKPQSTLTIGLYNFRSYKEAREYFERTAPVGRTSFLLGHVVYVYISGDQWLVPRTHLAVYAA